MNTIDVTALSKEERKKLFAQLQADEKSEKKKREGDIEALKRMADEFCANWLQRLFKFSQEQSNLVDLVFQDAKSLIDLKSDLYDVDESQGSHTFTARDGSGSIKIGHNQVIGFDVSIDIGVQKIQKYLSSLSKDDVNRGKIEKILAVLLRTNKKGQLNPTRVVDLSNLKAEIDDELFSDGVDTVVGGQFKTKSSSYVEGWMRHIDANDKETKLTFRLTAK